MKCISKTHTYDDKLLPVGHETIRQIEEKIVEMAR